MRKIIASPTCKRVSTVQSSPVHRLLTPKQLSEEQEDQLEVQLPMYMIVITCSMYMYIGCTYRYMRTPERLSTLRNARQTLRNRDRKIACVKKQLELMTSERGVAVESHVNEEIKQVIEKEKAQRWSLSLIFWEQQVRFCVKYYTFT